MLLKPKETNQSVHLQCVTISGHVTFTDTHSKYSSCPSNQSVSYRLNQKAQTYTIFVFSCLSSFEEDIIDHRNGEFVFKATIISRASVQIFDCGGIILSLFLIVYINQRLETSAEHCPSMEVETDLFELCGE